MQSKTFAAFLVDSLGQIKGKKAFQKLVYLAKAHGIPIKHAYKMHYYGPYSESLAEDFEEIYRMDIVDLVPGSSYIYQKGSQTEKVLREGRDEIRQFKPILDLIIQRFGNMTPRDLEIYATAHFIWKIQRIFNRPTDKQSLIEEIKKAKYPKFSLEEIENALNNLIQWKVVQLN